ncbi:hypothetical protein E2C01_029281 [Portunus trituberculatus]|uniref:Uncharacterized protein n=1 Tax=Portunus trituberculatus TaxID=210409 RepID=A0A5B7ESG0_PORTR|nr:hypothetical protein [Portunus trituberculatus]
MREQVSLLPVAEAVPPDPPPPGLALCRSPPINVPRDIWESGKSVRAPPRPVAAAQRVVVLGFCPLQFPTIL